MLGHESAGVVEKVGDQVSYVQPGDHVITCLSVYCGNCEYCLTGHLSLCDDKQAVQRPLESPQRLTSGGETMWQFFDLSSFAEMMLVHEHAIVKIRPDMPLDRAALIGCGVTTGVGAVFNTAKVEPGSTVAVIGCGGIGPQLHPRGGDRGSAPRHRRRSHPRRSSISRRRSARPTSSTRPTAAQ